MSELAAETKALQSTPFFAELSPEDIEGIIGIGEAVEVDAGTMIVEHGEVGDAMFVILAGVAEVDVGGRFHRLVRGDFFGEIALIAARCNVPTGVRSTVFRRKFVFVFERQVLETSA